MSATTATRNPVPTATPLALDEPRFSKPASGRSVVPGAASRVGTSRPRLRIVADGEQAPVITRITPAPLSEPSALVDPSSVVEPVETIRRVDLDQFFAPVPGGESQKLVAIRPRAARLTRRGRTVVMGLSLAVALGLGVLWASGSAATEHPEQTRVVRVHTGDTLWDISSAAAAATGGGDVRSMMSTIEQLNHLDSAVLQAGQTIRVPQ